MNIKIVDQTGYVYIYEDVEGYGIFGEMFAILIDGEEFEHYCDHIVSVKEF